jgi:hypothetical protein
LELSQRDEQLVDLRTLAASFIGHHAGLADRVFLVIDDGGHALSQFSRLQNDTHNVAGLEQTASGLWQVAASDVSFPIVDVGASAVKRICEPSLIIEAALSRAFSYLPKNIQGLKCGVVGLGYIGRALARRLTQVGAELSVYDIRQKARAEFPSAQVASIQALFDRSDIIFGCTGTDITAGLFNALPEGGLRISSRVLISLSSGDDEFFRLKAELLGKTARPTGFFTLATVPDIQGEHWGSEFSIVRNGFPINFDNSIESVPVEKIQGTVAALIGATAQSYRYATQSDGHARERIMLDVGFQQWLYSKWHPLLSGTSRLDEGELTAQTITDISTLRARPRAIDKGDHFGAWAIRR